MYVVRERLDAESNLRFAYSGTDGNVHILTVDNSSKSVVDVATIEVSGPGAVITFIGGERSQPDDPDEGLWVAGDNGMIRYIALEGGSFGNLETHDLPTTDTVLFIANGYASTSGGQVYTYDPTDKIFIARGTPRAAAIHFAGNQISAGDSGLIRVEDSTFFLGDLSIRTARVSYHAPGSAVELIDNFWRHRTHVYDDSPTSMSLVRPDTISEHINHQAYTYTESDSPLVITFELSDPDHNYHMPDIQRVTPEGNRYGLYQTDSDTIEHAQPNQLCTFGTTSLNDSVIQTVLTPDSVRIQTHVKTGMVKPTCPDCYWASQPRTFSISWVRGDTLIVVLSSDTLKIVHDAEKTSATLKITAGEARVPSIRYTGTHAIFPVPAEKSSVTLDVFDLLGKRVYSTRVSDLHHVTISRSLLPHVFVARLRNDTGKLYHLKGMQPSGK